MMQTLAVNSTNDIFLDDNGNIAIDRDLLAVRDVCASVSKVRKGEFVLNTTLGMPFLQSVFIGSPNLFQYQATLLIALKNVQEVNRVSGIEMQISGTILYYTAQIITNFGSILLEEQINGSL